MIPISLCWDSRKRSVFVKWDGFISSGWQDGRTLTKILGLPIPLPLRKKRVSLRGKLSIRWVDLKGVLSLLPKWKLKKVEGTFSFPDPMVNGVLYGWMSAIQGEKADRKNYPTVSFLGENWCRGEMTLSLKIFVRYLRSFVFPLILERRGRKPRKGGG
jgi:hypothetical protein